VYLNTLALITTENMKMKSILLNIPLFVLLAYLFLIIFSYTSAGLEGWAESEIIIIGLLCLLTAGLVLRMKHRCFPLEAGLDRSYSIVKIIVLLMVAVSIFYYYVLRPIHQDNELGNCLKAAKSSDVKIERCFKQF
jgi:hypothetical protein